MSLAPHRVDYSPIIERPPIKWPNGARVALWVAPNVEHYEYMPGYDGERNPWPRMPSPDAREFSYRDYGNRVGFWRMAEVLDKHGGDKPKTATELGVALKTLYNKLNQYQTQNQSNAG